MGWLWGLWWGLSAPSVALGVHWLPPLVLVILLGLAGHPKGGFTPSLGES